MQAKDRRYIHFRSSVGSMLNENYWHGLIQDTLQQTDYVHNPTSSLPTSAKALEFLDKKFFPPKPERISSSSTNRSDLIQAYRNVSNQPIGMVHYDRDPFYWPGKEKQTSDYEAPKQNYIHCGDYLFNHGRGYELVTPDDTKSRSLSTATGRNSKLSIPSCKSGDRSSRAKVVQYDRTGSRESLSQERTKTCIEDKIVPHGIRFAVLSEDNLLDKDGFKAYSPFTDTCQDFDVKQAMNEKHAKVYDEVDDIKEYEENVINPVIRPPNYTETLNKVLDISPEVVDRFGKYTKRRPADILKLHGNPEYPTRVIDEKDVPNYVAWAKIYPYCPLTQKEGEKKPVVVPPRGFTPSVSSHQSPQAKLKDIKQAKKNIMEGIKLLSSSSRKRQQKLQQAGNNAIKRDTNMVGTQAVKDKPDTRKQEILKGQQMRDHKNMNKPIQNWDVDAIEDVIHGGGILHRSQSQLSLNYQDENLLNRKMMAARQRDAIDTWYSGKTPSRTPSPASRLPMNPNRSWVKHYSPARVQRFLEAVSKHNTNAVV